MHFKQRHPGPELMDDPNIDPNELRINLQELETINKLLGGYSVTLKGLKTLMRDPSKTYQILDVGCGGGDTLAAIWEWANRKNLKVQLTGLDLSETAIEYTRKRCSHITNLKLMNQPFQTLAANHEKFDIITCSLFCHHFYGEELKLLIQIMHENSEIGFVINDLERNKIAWASIASLTRLFSKSRLVKHDAPMSVKRGFTKSDWVELLKKSRVQAYDIRWMWAFRHCIIGRKE